MLISEIIGKMSEMGYDVKRSSSGGQYGRRYNVYRAGFLVGRFTKGQIVRDFLEEYVKIEKK